MTEKNVLESRLREQINSVKKKKVKKDNKIIIKNKYKTKHIAAVSAIWAPSPKLEGRTAPRRRAMEPKPHTCSLPASSRESRRVPPPWHHAGDRLGRPGAGARCLPAASCGAKHSPGQSQGLWRTPGQARGKQGELHVGNQTCRSRGSFLGPGSLRALEGKSHNVRIPLPLLDSFTFMLY